MASLIELKVPDIGNFTDVDVIDVLVKPGDVIAVDQTLAVLETDKASMDLPASAAGTVQEVFIKVGDKVSEGSLIATVSAEAEQAGAAKPEEKPEPKEAAPEEKAPEQPAQAAPQPAPAPKPASAPEPAAQPASGKAAHATPAVRLFARELGVDISKITAGSGRKGRILKEDVKNHVKQIMTEGFAQGGAGIPPIPAVDFSQFGAIEEQKLNKIKRLTGQNLSRAWLNLPMVTYHEEVDITEMEAFRNALNAEKAAGDTKITGLVFIIKALIAAMQQFPQFNSSLSTDGEKLIYKKYFNVGIAVDTPNGLVVPVIRDADKKGINELTAELADKSAKARQGKLMPADMQGGCITISSLGGIGGTAFTPIVNAPEVAILGITRSKMQPIWDGREFVPRLMLPLDLTYDHRVIDGAEGARFMAVIKQYLGDIRRLLL
ncbi:dihydrolipoyllysine-residue acetyltransferase [Methylobacter sp. BlB1]|uniref:dihydrolipoyllysine-residue acetyltransferase n=1 Tax=unclassified Methylobacter TaxID=2635283 RepID=UPI001895B716|nr:dihydrolipoyllysine-residue acetyltransferase [Methylobacter sp. BlB1]MBF6647615.1 dihydrolipoyllysine-residue acetyltransferase [Methylobacter sp. BlB1]